MTEELASKIKQLHELRKTHADPLAIVASFPELWHSIMEKQLNHYL